MKLLDVKTPDIKSISKKFNVDINWLKDQLKMGIEVEKEHTTRTDVAKEIALDHLGEDPNYYKKLKKIDKN